jgi:hypothetical protein
METVVTAVFAILSFSAVMVLIVCAAGIGVAETVPLLEIRGTRKLFGRVVALDGVAPLRQMLAP